MHKILAPVALLLAIGAALAQAPAQPSDAEKKALDRVRQVGGLALELAQNDNHLDVSYLQSDGKFSADYLMPLHDLKGLVVHLNLRGQPVTDADLAQLRDLTALTELHLENTKVTDRGLENLKGLTNLEYLNLYGTQVSDAGLVNLEGLKKLKHLYLWQTKATAAGVAKLKKAVPAVDVNLGADLDKPVAAAKPEAKSAGEKKPAEKKAEAKPADKKPEAKPADKKPAEKKADAKPAEKQSDAKPADKKPEGKKEDPKKPDAGKK
jgi:hypothetical protein